MPRKVENFGRPLLENRDFTHNPRHSISAGKNCQYCQLLHFWCPSNVAGNETFAPSETLKYPRLPSL